MKLVADMLATKHWIYPLNQSKRDYQYNIVKACLFDNTIVALPTGMGKTFIAGCVMLNCTLHCAHDVLYSRFQIIVGFPKAKSFSSRQPSLSLLSRLKPATERVASLALMLLS